MKRFSRKPRRSTTNPNVFDRIANVAAHSVPNRIAEQQILNSFTDRIIDLDSPDDLIARGRSLAIIEVAINGDGLTRRHSYRPGLGFRQMLLRDDSGGKALVWSSTPGSVIRGYDHLSDMAPSSRQPRSVWPGVLDTYPPSLADCPRLDEEDGVENITFCYWWFSGGPWNRGPVEFPVRSDTDPDGSWHLLRTVSSDKEALRFLTDTYGGHFPDDVLDDFARPRVLPGMLQTLPIDRPLEAVVEELTGIGYTV